MEYLVVARLIGGFCLVCKILKNTMGHESSILRTNDEYLWRDKLRYLRALESGGLQCLKDYGLQLEVNLLCAFAGCETYHLWQPDIPDLLTLGIVKTTIEWVIGYMEDRKLVGQFNSRFK